MPAVGVGQGRGQHPQHPGRPGLLPGPEGVLGARGERERVTRLEHDFLARDVQAEPARQDEDEIACIRFSLTLMLYLLVPWTALNLVDFFFVRRGHYAITDIFRPDGVYGAWGWRGLTAYALGFAAEIPFMVLPPIAGFS